MNEQTLLKLYGDTFTAEEGESVDGTPWEPFLKNKLSVKFIIRRSDISRENESRDQMLNDIRQSIKNVNITHERRDIMWDQTVVWCSGKLGVVAGPIAMDTPQGRRQFQNVKVFEDETDEDGTLCCRCVYWQVTEMPLSQPGTQASRTGQQMQPTAQAMSET